MLHVKVDLCPGGFESMRETLTEMWVVNDGTRSGTGRGDYNIFTEHPGNCASVVARIENFDRARGANALVETALYLVDDALKDPA